MKSSATHLENECESTLALYEKKTVECGMISSKIAEVAKIIQFQQLPQLNHSDHGPNLLQPEMLRIFQLIDNFKDGVIPLLEQDLSSLEEIVEELERAHDIKASPVSTFISGIFASGVKSEMSGPADANTLEEKRMRLHLHSEVELRQHMYAGVVPAVHVDGAQVGECMQGQSNDCNEELSGGGELVEDDSSCVDGDDGSSSEEDCEVEGAEREPRHLSRFNLL